ncbi:hypothetical protein AV530_009273 [Patagioenas fasciata monilis]|uniref:Uncharacterized protein n=1 Tax=Patagioenas fasciata monilis TaxID=372326 RepID=A0A1V4JIA2_PATFA|nr:hypothetical protein AV530_009273 [Patagioenas fasciata monilis]
MRILDSCGVQRDLGWAPPSRPARGQSKISVNSSIVSEGLPLPTFHSPVHQMLTTCVAKCIRCRKHWKWLQTLDRLLSPQREVHFAVQSKCTGAASPHLKHCHRMSVVTLNQSTSLYFRNHFQGDDYSLTPDKIPRWCGVSRDENVFVLGRAAAPSPLQRW